VRRKKSKRVAVLWTGGKDSCCALQEARQAGHEVVLLATFLPKDPDFLAHPVKFMKAQAKALDLPWIGFSVSEPYRRHYEKGLAELKKKHGIDAVVTGDISEVDGLPNWIRECAREARIEVLTPLWEVDRLSQMQRLLTDGFGVVFSCVKHRWMKSHWAGKRLDESSLRKLRDLREENGIDLCGEQGEFHTLVFEAPCFKKRIEIQEASIQMTPELSYLKVHSLRVV